jgi:hypothetical protein
VTGSEYTPPMDRLKSDYMRMREEHFGFSDLYAAEWDRALAEHDRQVAERAWNEGRASASIMLPSYPPQLPKNPYRKEQR